MKLVVPGSIVAIALVATLVFRMVLESITGVTLSSGATSVVGAMFIALGLTVRWLWTRGKKDGGAKLAAKAAAGGKQ